MDLFFNVILFYTMGVQHLIGHQGFVDRMSNIRKGKEIERIIARMWDRKREEVAFTYLCITDQILRM